MLRNPEVFSSLPGISARTLDGGKALNYTLVNMKDWCKNSDEVIDTTAAQRSIDPAACILVFLQKKQKERKDTALISDAATELATTALPDALAAWLKGSDKSERASYRCWLHQWSAESAIDLRLR